MVRRPKSCKLLTSDDVWRWLKLPKSPRLYSRTALTASTRQRMSLLPPYPSTDAVGQMADLAVIDTNVLLDWLVFEDNTAAALGQAIATGSLQWIGTRAMRDEFEHVLERPVFERWTHRREAALEAAERHCLMVSEPSIRLAGRLHCTDPDDQKFIDLALVHPARWLLSRDKSLLRLARKSRLRGVGVLTPAAWASLAVTPSKISDAP